MISNVRHYLLHLLLPAKQLPAMLLLAMLAAPGGAALAESDTQARLSQLERVSSAHSQVLTELQQQVTSNQTDIDSLRGQIQESQYQLNQVIERQKQILLQLDNMANGTSTQNAVTQNADTQSNVPPDSATTPADGTAAAPETATTASKPGQTGNEKSDYQAAVTLIHDKARINDAIAAFTTFSKNYPKSKLQPNANYWLGQLNYSAGKTDNALYYFAKVAKDYPTSAKAPEALYKVGVIMQEKGDKTQAKAVYSQVIRQYPESASAKLAAKKLKS